VKLKDDPELKALQKHWYKKLKDEGFNDIEDTNSPRELLKQWHSTYFYRHYTVETFQDKQDYWRTCSRFLHSHTFQTVHEKKVWELYCDGQSLRQIADQLRTKKKRVNKDSLNKIVSNLIKIMKANPEVTEDTEAMDKKDLIFTRDATPDDVNFIFATWLRGLRYGNHTFELIHQEIYFTLYHQVIEKLLSSPTVKIKVSALIEDPTVILGYCVSDQDVVHWTFVKDAWRGIGIMKSLLPKDFTTVTHITNIGEEIIRKKFPHIIFNPFLGG